MKFRIASKLQTLTTTHRNVSFINPFSCVELIKAKASVEEIVFGVDGVLLAALASKLCATNIERLSFDFTSVASTVFLRSEAENRSVALLGATIDQVLRFREKILTRFPHLKIEHYLSGYESADAEMGFFSRIQSDNVDTLVLSLGAVRQETTLLRAREAGYVGHIYTCGGFFRQYATTDNENYYPYIIDKANLRFLYRMWQEPHTIGRYLVNYPTSISKILYMHSTGQLSFEVID